MASIDEISKCIQRSLSSCKEPQQVSKLAHKISQNYSQLEIKMDKMSQLLEANPSIYNDQIEKVKLRSIEFIKKTNEFL